VVPDVIGAWRVVSNAADVLELSTSVDIEIEGLASTATCTTAVNALLTAVQNVVETSPKLVRDPSLGRQPAPLSVDDGPIPERVQGCASASGFSTMIGTARWIVSAPVASDGSSQNVTLGRTIFMKFESRPANIGCRALGVNDWVWLVPGDVSKASSRGSPILLSPSSVWLSMNPSTDRTRPRSPCS
jgi:hypothetical protein